MKMNAKGLNTRHDGEEPKAPARLVAALKELPPRRVFVPPTVNDAVLAAARRHFSKPSRWFGFDNFRLRWLWPAVATACLVVVGISYFLIRPGQPRFAREDLNRDGKVDILDAFALARESQANVRLPTSFDLNGDGVVDRRDAEWIAVQAVRLEKGGRS